MKTPLFLAIVIAASFLSFSKVAAQTTTDLLSLSSPAAFGPLVSPTFSTAVGTQTSSGFVYNGSVNLGDNVFGEIAASQNWSTQMTTGVVLSLFMNVSGTNPNIPFSLELFDSSFGTIDIWEGTTVGLTASSTYANLSIATAGSGVYTDVGSFVFTWNPGSTETINSTIGKIAAVQPVPEPSTYALLAMTGLAFGGYVMRRRRRE